MKQSTQAIENVADEATYARLRGELKRAVQRVCPSNLVDRADDLIQAGMMKVMQLQRKCESERDFSPAYLWRVAYSALVDEIRKLRRTQVVSLVEEDNQNGVWLADEGPGPEKSFTGSQVGSAIRNCLLRLVTPRRLAVTLYLQGHGVPDSARLLGWKTKKVENLVYRGLQNLRQCLTSKGYKP